MKATKPTDRRSFLAKTGAALIASATAGAAAVRPDEPRTLQQQLERLTRELGLLEDTNAIRALHAACERGAQNGSFEQAAEFFTADAQIEIDGQVCADLSEGVRRWRSEQRAPLSGALPRKQDFVEVAADGRSASARFHQAVHAWSPGTGPSSVLEMARQQGQGVDRLPVDGVYDNLYVKDGDRWRIKRLAYRQA